MSKSTSTSPVKKSAARQPMGIDGIQKPDMSVVKLARKSMGVPNSLPKNGTFAKAAGDKLNRPTAKSGTNQPTGLSQPPATARGKSLNRPKRSQ